MTTLRRALFFSASLSCAAASCGACEDVAILGDSISVFYPRELATMLGSEYRVDNFAEPGAVTGEIRNNWTWKVDEFDHYDAVVVMGGSNDLATTGTPATAFAQLDLLYNAAIADGLDVYAFTVLPRTDVANATVEELNDLIRAKTGITVLDVYADFLDGGSIKSEWYAPDGVHPTGDGVTHLADTVAAALGVTP